MAGEYSRQERSDLQKWEHELVDALTENERRELALAHSFRIAATVLGHLDRLQVGKFPTQFHNYPYASGDYLRGAILPVDSTDSLTPIDTRRIVINQTYEDRVTAKRRVFRLYDFMISPSNMTIGKRYHSRNYLRTGNPPQLVHGSVPVIMPDQEAGGYAVIESAGYVLPTPGYNDTERPLLDIALFQNDAESLGEFLGKFSLDVTLESRI